MHKGMLSGLCSLKWVLLCLLLTGCPGNDDPLPPPPPPSPEITVTGQIMLGPVIRGHSLQIVIYDTEMKELDRPKIGLDGSYGFTLKDYEGGVIAQATSTNPQQECSVGDYIDEATAKPKCLGNNSILSSTVLKLDNTSSDNQAKLHTTSVTTIAALNAGISINEDGTMAINDNLSPEIIDRSNKTIARALGLGDQSVAEYTPKSIITTDQKFQSGDAYSQALAEISGIEAEGKSLNSIVKLISADIGKNGKLSPAVQDMMVKGNQKVFKTAKEQGADTTILNQINKRQDTYPDSITKVDMVNAPEPPVFENKTKTSNQKPTWEWISGGTGNNRYQYRFGAEDDIQNVRNWTKTSSSSFTSKDNLKPGKYILEIQEGHTSDQTVWSPVTNSIIEIVENQKGAVAIQGEAIQGRKLIAVPTDNDGIQSEISYQWYRDNKTIKNATYSDYVLTEEDVNKAITVQISYIDNVDYAERDIQSAPVKVDNIDDKPILIKPKDVQLNEDADTHTIILVANDIDNEDIAITYEVFNDNSEIVDVVNYANKQLNITPIKDKYGEANITVTAVSNGLKDEETFKIIINDLDDDPIIKTKLSHKEIDENSDLIVITLDTTDIDNENTEITHQATSTDDKIATVEIKNGNVLNIRPVKYKHGEVTITVTAISNGQRVEEDFKLTINNKDDKATGKVIIENSFSSYRQLSANTTGIFEPDDIKSISYQWKADNSDVSGAVQKDFFPTDEEIRKEIYVVVNIEDELGNKTSFTSEKTPKLKAHGIPPTVKNAIEMGAQFKDGDFDINETLSNANFFSQYNNPSTPLTFVITAIPSRGVIINNYGTEITQIENGKYLEVSEGFKYKRTKAGKDSFEYKGKRDKLLSLKPATINISYNNKAPNASAFTISAAVETETRSIPFAENITDDQDATESIIITDYPQRGNLYINGKSLDSSKLETTLIGINSNVTYKSIDTGYSSDSFKYKAIDANGIRSFESSVRIELIINDKAPEIVKEQPAQTDLMIDEAGNQISFKFKITDDSSTFTAYEPLFLSTKGVASRPAWIDSIDIGDQSDGSINYTINATLNDKSYANDSIRVLIPVVDDLGLKSKYAFVINPEFSVATENNFIQKNNTTWVDVCWQFSEKTVNLDANKITDIKQEIMNTISDSWQKNSALKFDWREDDWKTMQDVELQLFKWNSPSNCAENYTADYAQVKVYIKQPDENDSEQAENHFTINLNVNADGTFVDTYPKQRIIHEFGHALGFPDENKRFDIFAGELSKKSIELWHSWECVKSMNIQKPRVATDSDLISTTAVREISYKEWQQQPYDSYSIMDECIFDNPSVYKNSASNIQTDMLKINDKKRVQKFYGAPIIETESPHLIKDDQFFTGLFLHGSDYFYYGNGVKSSTDRFINTISLKILFDNGIYISALSSDINEDVLFKKTYDGDSPPSFISPFPSLLISCAEEQDDSTKGFRYRHADDCNSPDNLIADNESVYYFYDNPQNIKFYSCATDPNNSSETNNCSEISGSWLVSEGVLFAKGIKNNATYFYKNY